MLLCLRAALPDAYHISAVAFCKIFFPQKTRVLVTFKLWLFWKKFSPKKVVMSCVWRLCSSCLWSQYCEHFLFTWRIILKFDLCCDPHVEMYVYSDDWLYDSVLDLVSETSVPRLVFCERFSCELVDAWLVTLVLHTLQGQIIGHFMTRTMCNITMLDGAA